MNLDEWTSFRRKPQLLSLRKDTRLRLKKLALPCDSRMEQGAKFKFPSFPQVFGFSKASAPAWRKEKGKKKKRELPFRVYRGSGAGGERKTFLTQFSPSFPWKFAPP